MPSLWVPCGLRVCWHITGAVSSPGPSLSPPSAPVSGLGAGPEGHLCPGNGGPCPATLSHQRQWSEPGRWWRAGTPRRRGRRMGREGRIRACGVCWSRSSRGSQWSLLRGGQTGHPGSSQPNTGTPFPSRDPKLLMPSQGQGSRPGSQELGKKGSQGGGVGWGGLPPGPRRLRFPGPKQVWLPPAGPLPAASPHAQPVIHRRLPGQGRATARFLTARAATALPPSRPPTAGGWRRLHREAAASRYRVPEVGSPALARAARRAIARVSPAKLEGLRSSWQLEPTHTQGEGSASVHASHHAAPLN